jgi:hypothetical protein
MIVSAETAKIQQLREEYEKQGYTVVERPGPEEFPFQAGYGARYRPAMLARRGKENVVIEIRESADQASDRLIERSQAIRKQPNWRFYLVTSDDVVPHDAPGIQGGPPCWPELEHTVGEALALAQPLPSWMRLLVLFTALEGVLRRIAVDDGMPVDRLPASTLITALYDYGLIPIDAYERLMAAHEVHRRVRHGYPTADEKVAEAVRAVSEWLPQLLPHAVERAA